VKGKLNHAREREKSGEEKGGEKGEKGGKNVVGRERGARDPSDGSGGWRLGLASLPHLPPLFSYSLPAPEHDEESHPRSRDE
jgi:hypothetical protein